MPGRRKRPHKDTSPFPRILGAGYSVLSIVNASLPDDVAAARKRFEEACTPLRADLHRFCTRMTGDPCDGEDVLQDALAAAFYRFPELRDGAAFRSWMFRIAHNRCIDFL